MPAPHFFQRLSAAGAALATLVVGAGRPVHAAKPSDATNKGAAATRTSVAMAHSPNNFGKPVTSGKALAFTPVNAKTLLDEGGNMSFHVPDTKIRFWKDSLKSSATSSLAPLYHFWLGECELAQQEDPRSARWHFAQVQTSKYASAELKGQAKYDAAVALYYEGAYVDCSDAFWRLLTGKEKAAGLDKRRLALWYKHAAACAGYHASRSELGIPEPPRLDPKCAAAALATCLRALKMPYDEKSVLKVCKVTGEGSSLRDVLNAAKQLDVNAYVFGADEAGLKAAPMPLVAYVEHDHFIAVTHADKTGVTYLCSDCGAWPGGQVHLNWKQWRAVDPSLYTAIARKNSNSDLMLAAVTSGQIPPMTRLAVAGPGRGILPAAQEWIHTAHVLQPHLILAGNAGNPSCGHKMKGLKCAPMIKAPMINGSGSNGKGCTCGDPVNAASGEEEYSPGSDLTVYNSLGPSVSWDRVYNSLRGEDASTNSDDFGMGWSHSYNIGVFVPTQAAPQGVPIVYGVVGQSITLPATSLEGPASAGWDIVREGTFANPQTQQFVASQTQSNYWVVTKAGTLQGTTISVTPPSGTPTGYYRVRYTGDPGSGTGYSAPFYIASLSTGGATTITFSYNQGSNGEITQAFTPDTHTTHNEFVVFPNGGRVSFQVNSANPTGSQPEVEPGGPFTVGCIATVPGTSYYYVITFPDQTKWVTAPFSAGAPLTDNGTPVGTFVPLTKIEDAAGRYIQLNYGAVGASGFPLLSSITNSASKALLTIFRNPADGSNGVPNAINAVKDYYGHYVQYHETTIGWQNMPMGKTHSSTELDKVYQATTSPTTPPTAPTRYIYGYTMVDILDGAHELAPFLGTITTPSLNPGGSSPAATIAYDPQTDFVSSITDGNSNTTTFTQVTGPGSSTAVLAGTPTSCTKVTVTGGMGGSYTYYVTYDGLMNQTGTTDGTGTVIPVSLAFGDPNNPYRPSKVVTATNLEWDYSWDTFGRPLTITSGRLDGLGGHHHYTYSYASVAYIDFSMYPGLSVPPVLRTIQEDTKTPIWVTYTQELGRTPGNLIGQIAYSPADFTAYPHNTATKSNVTSIVYDSLGNPITISRLTDGIDHTASAKYDVTTYGYGTTAPEMLGKPLTITNNDGKTWTLAYDANTNLQSVTDPKGNKTQYFYNVLNLPSSIVEPATGQNGSGNNTVNIYRAFPDADPYSAVLLDESGATVRQVTTTYGPEGEVLSSAGDAQPFAATYDMLYRLKTIADGNGHVTNYSYNTAGYLSQIKYPGSTGGTAQTVSYPLYDAAGNVKQRIDGRGIVTNYTYNDPEGLLTNVAYPAFPTNNLTYGYDVYGRLSQVMDGAGTTLGYNYDDLDELTSTTTKYSAWAAAKTVGYTHYIDGARKTMTTPLGTYNYGYDNARRLNSITDPSGNASSWTYDTNGWLLTAINAGLTTTTYGYLPNGLVSSQKTVQTGVPTNVLANFITLKYDGAGKLKSMTGIVPYAYGTANNLQHAFTYDNLGRLTQENVGPATPKAVSLDGTTGYVTAGNTSVGNFGTADFTVSLWVNFATYGTQKQYLVSKRATAGHGSYFDLFVTTDGYLEAEVDQDASGTNYLDYKETTKRVVDNRWHQVAMVRHGVNILLYVDGTLVGTSPNAAGTANISNTAPLSLGYVSAQPTLFTKGNLDEVRLYATQLSAADLTRLATGPRAVNPPVNAILYWNFETVPTTYTVDQSGYGTYGNYTGGVTLVGGCPVAGYISNFDYGTDLALNITGFAGTAHSYDVDNVIDSFTALDGDGNPGSLRGMPLSYDVEDRLTGAGPESLTYRPDGLRAIQTDGPGAVRTYLYDGAAPVEELDGAGNIVADHEYGPTGYLGNNDRGPFNTFTTDPTGNGIQSYSLAAGFSPVAYPMGAYGTLGGTNVPTLYYKLQNDFYYGWNGASGLIGMGARNYDAQTGRFLTRDPLGYGGGINLYAFAGGDPINNSDPDGLFPDGDPLGEMFQGWDNAGEQAATEVGVAGATGLRIVWYGISKVASIFRAPQGGDMLDPPNPYVRPAGMPGPVPGGEGPHNETIARRAAEIQKEHPDWKLIGGGGKEKEMVIKTPGGAKSSRRPDISFRRPDGTICHENVGRVQADGTPVKREIKALDDIERATGTRPGFTPYFK